MDEKDRIRLAAFAITGAWEGALGYSNYQNYDAGVISYGRFQFTLAAGSLSNVLDSYLQRSTSPVAQQLSAYADRVRAGDATLRDDEVLKALLIQAGEEDEMRDAQDEVVIKRYWNPSQDSATSRGVVTPLGQALFFDMAVQHGPGHKHIQNAEAFYGVPPKSRLSENGLTEQQLIERTAIERRDFLHRFADKNNLPGVKRRGDFWVGLVQIEDWQLQGDGDGHVFVYGKPVQVRNPDTGRKRRLSTAESVSVATASPALDPEPGQPISGTYATHTPLKVRERPDASSKAVASVRKGEKLQVTRRYAPSPGEEWLKAERGWIARLHPSSPGEVFGELELD